MRHACVVGLISLYILGLIFSNQPKLSNMAITREIYHAKLEGEDPKCPKQEKVWCRCADIPKKRDTFIISMSEQMRAQMRDCTSEKPEVREKLFRSIGINKKLADFEYIQYQFENLTGNTLVVNFYDKEKEQMPDQSSQV